MTGRTSRLLRGAVLVVALLTASVLLIGAVYHGFANAASSEVQRRGLAPREHNALKHAFAAAETYAASRRLLGPERAASFVVWLGIRNEWLERYARRTTDWSAEVYKDLRNNLAGIAAAEWLHDQAGYASFQMRLRLIGKLAADGFLVPTDEDPRLPPLPKAPDTATAIEQSRADEGRLRAAMAAELASKTPELRAELGL